MLQFLLTALGAIMLSAAGLHLAVGMRRQGDRVHLSFGVTALLFGLFTLCSVPIIAAQTLQAVEPWEIAKRAVSWAAWLALLWFCLEFTGNRRLRWVILFFAPPMFFILPEQFGKANEIRFVELPWGETISSFGGSTGPVGYVWMLASVVTLIYVGITAFRLSREERARGSIFGLAVLFCALSIVDDMIPVIASFGDEAGFAVFVVLMNVYLIDDVVEVKRARQAEKLSSARLRALVDTSPEAILLLDTERDRIVAANALAETFFGDAIVTEPTDALVRASQPMQTEGSSAEKKLHDLCERAKAGERVVSDWSLRGVEGAIPCELRILRLAPEDPLLRISFIDLRAQELAEQRRMLAEEQVRRAQRLNSLGQMTSRIAHDLNNLLVPIVARTDLALDHAENNPQLKGDLTGIAQAAERASALARQILTYSAGKPRGEHCDAREVISSVLPLLHTASASEVDLEVETTEPLPVAIAPEKLEQLLTNLVINAYHASSPGMTIRVEGQIVTIDATLRTRHPGFEPEQAVLLVVEDDGIGMTPEVLERAFQPFFSTKGPDEGTGLGLAIVKDTVEENGGSLKVESAPGRGARFEILLPVPGETNGDREAIRDSA